MSHLSQKCKSNRISIWGFPQMGYLQHRCFIWKNRINMDDLGVPLNTGNHHVVFRVAARLLLPPNSCFSQGRAKGRSLDRPSFREPHPLGSWLTAKLPSYLAAHAHGHFRIFSRDQGLGPRRFTSFHRFQSGGRNRHLEQLVAEQNGIPRGWIDPVGWLLDQDVFWSLEFNLLDGYCLGDLIII